MADRSHRPHSHRNQHRPDEIKLIDDMRRRNPHTGLVIFWVKLMQRGFGSSLVKDCIPADTFAREKAAALRVLALKFKPAADRQKMMANLYSKGFDSSAIRAAVEEFQQAEEDE